MEPSPSVLDSKLQLIRSESSFVFRPFSRLPQELQDVVWAMAIPSGRSINFFPHITRSQIAAPRLEYYALSAGSFLSARDENYYRNRDTTRDPLRRVAAPKPDVFSAYHVRSSLRHTCRAARNVVLRLEVCLPMQITPIYLRNGMRPGIKPAFDAAADIFCYDAHCHQNGGAQSQTFSIFAPLSNGSLSRKHFVDLRALRDSQHIAFAFPEVECGVITNSRCRPVTYNTNHDPALHQLKAAKEEMSLDAKWTRWNRQRSLDYARSIWVELVGMEQLRTVYLIAAGLSKKDAVCLKNGKFELITGAKHDYFEVDVCAIPEIHYRVMMVVCKTYMEQIGGPVAFKMLSY